ncbi:MAG: hypothetical protein J6Q54_03145 [Oscillospiraceae bacterium]|nr:hypothetical protein [Oscillospiraceae bacterium]
MKRKFLSLFAIILCLVLCLPSPALAATYKLGDTAVSISVDDTIWYVFTRENIENNAELDELGVSYQDMYAILQDNDAYMDAVLFYEDGTYLELFVCKTVVDAGVAQLSNYKTKEVEELAKELAKDLAIDTYSVYENQYKYVKLEYVDDTYGYYVCEYVTIVNKDTYSLKFQSETAFVDAEYEEMKKIVDSIAFDVDTSLKEPEDSFAESTLVRTVSAAVIGGVIGGVVSWRNKKKKEKETAQSAEPEKQESE